MNKNIRGFLGVIISLVLTFLVIMPVYGSDGFWSYENTINRGKRNGERVLKEMKDVPINKEFTVKFNEKVDTEEVESFVTLLRECKDGIMRSEKTCMVSANDSEEEKNIYSIGLNSNTRYILILHKGIESNEGNVLKKDVYLPFITEKK